MSSIGLVRCMRTFYISERSLSGARYWPTLPASSHLLNAGYAQECLALKSHKYRMVRDPPSHQQNLKDDVFLNRKPVQVLKYWCDVIASQPWQLNFVHSGVEK